VTQAGQTTDGTTMELTFVRGRFLKCGRAVSDDGVEVASIAVHHAPEPAWLAEVAHDASAAGAVKRVLVDAGLQEELLAEAVDCGAAVCGRPVQGFREGRGRGGSGAHEQWRFAWHLPK
jgi:hypothetical protein